ncbi:hypothetical protein EQH57_0645 [Dictyocoela roeselum]|nr:hypothetical protein EQH57_0645 [Dictyocoela roeselum]
MAKLNSKLSQFLLNIEERYKKMVDEAICTACLGPVSLRKNKKYIVRCTKSKCRKSFSLFRSILLHKKKISIQTIYTIIFYWVNNIDINNISIISNVSEFAVREIIDSFSFIFRRKFEEDLVLGGENVIVECDESKFGKRKNHLVQKVEGVWVFGMVERTEKRKIYLTEIKDKKEPTLIPLIMEKIIHGSKIYTDCFSTYNLIDQNIFTHKNVNHSKYFVDSITGVHTQTIEANWSALKRTTHKKARAKGRIEIYLVRFMVIRNLGEKIFEEELNETFY